MGDASDASLTAREAEIMDRLWELGAATAEQIRIGLSGDPHDSTVRTLLRILEEKGCVRHRRDGRSFVYEPTVLREKVQRRTLGGLIRQLFSGSPKELVLRLLEDEQLTPADLEELLRQTSATPKPSKRRRSERS
jgi:BlaI family transcriptional regulator, penicillinase repressor